MTKPTVVLGAGSLGLSLILFGVVAFSLLRTARLAPVRPVVVVPVTNATAPVLATAQEREAACQAACVTSTCTQSLVTGVVDACTSGCGLPNQTNATGLCVDDGTACSSTPWCTTLEAQYARRLHAALMTALSENRTTVGNIATSSNWTTILQPVLTNTSAVALLDVYRATPPTGATPAVWFDDQTGWWGASLAAYQMLVAFPTYVASLKQLACTTHTWQAGAEACQPPAL